jgi:hypothetical protein
MSTGLKANNDGSAAIQVGGTDYIQIASTGPVTIPGNLTVTGTFTSGGGTVYNLFAYTSPTTWDATTKIAAGLKAIKVTVVGAGGNGGAAGPTGNNAGFGGGGAGGAAIEYVPASNITPGNKTVTAGPGTNSFGPWGTATPNSPTATVSATAGSAASGGSSGQTSGAAGGVGSGGAVNIAGGGGGAGAAQTFYGGAGGNSLLGAGAAGVCAPQTAGTVGVGQAGGNYGGGGGGASKAGPSPAAAGGTGAPGVVIVEEFY